MSDADRVPEHPKPKGLSLAMMDAGRAGAKSLHENDAKRATGHVKRALDSDEGAAHEDRHDDHHTDHGDSSQGWGGHVDEHTDEHIDTP